MTTGIVNAYPSDLNASNWKYWTVEMPKEMFIGPPTYAEYVKRETEWNLHWLRTPEDERRDAEDRRRYSEFCEGLRPLREAQEARLRIFHPEWVGDGNFCNGCD